MSKGNGTLAVYVDSRGNDQQRAALESIFTGAAGGPPSLFGPLIAKLLATKSAPITFAASGNSRTVSIANVTDVAIEGITGADGIGGGGKEVVWLENVSHPYSRRLAVAKGSSSKYGDHGLNFENTGRNGHFSHIDWSNG